MFQKISASLFGLVILGVITALIINKQEIETPIFWGVLSFLVITSVLFTKYILLDDFRK